MKNLLMIVFWLTVGVIHAQTATNEAVTWDYPVKPGTEEWKALLNDADMVKACQIPTDILKEITTTELAALCLNYPLKIKFYAYNNVLTGIRQVAAEFNGMQELLLRKDNAQCLLALLQDNILETLPEKNLPPIQNGELVYRHTVTEAMLAHESVIANAIPEQQRAIAFIAAKNISLKEQLPDTYSQYSVEVSAYLLCAGLKGINRSVLPTDLEQFLTTGSLRNDAQIEELKQLYSKTINQ